MSIIGISLKTYMGITQTKSLLEDLEPVFEQLQKSPIEFFIAPDIVSLGIVTPQILSQQQKNKNILLAAQDCFWEDSGAYTGTISPKNLAELGVKIVEVGHAEQRRIFGETDETVSKKVRAVISNNMIPLICIGENSKCSAESAIAECSAQLSVALSGLSNKSPFIVAYEPIWAIGKERPAEADYVKAVVQGLRHTEPLKSHLGNHVRVIYGGSAGPGLFQQLQPELDGLFLGRFGHAPKNIAAVIKEMCM